MLGQTVFLEQFSYKRCFFLTWSQTVFSIRFFSCGLGLFLSVFYIQRFLSHVESDVFLNRYFYNRRFFSSCWVRWLFRSWGINWRSVVFYLLSLGLPLLAYGIQLCPRMMTKPIIPIKYTRSLENLLRVFDPLDLLLPFFSKSEQIRNTWDKKGEKSSGAPSLTTVRRLNPVN